MLNLKRTVLVTGSTQGIGREIALACARAGANVVLHGLRDDEHAQMSIKLCKAEGVQVDFVCCDLADSSPTTTQRLFEQTKSLAPAIDTLVNNAGVCIDTPFLDMPPETFDKTMKVNVYSYFFLTQQFASHCVENKIDGRVLMIGSINGRLAEPTHAAYDTSKGAVEMMVKTLSVSLAPHSIRVNGLAPGLFYTPLTASGLDQPGVMDWMKLHTPNGDVPGPDVCGETAVFLLSDSARHITGQMLLVDGGMSAWQQPDMPD